MLSASSIQMLYGTFGDAGMCEMLERGYELMVLRLTDIVAADIIDVEPGVLDGIKAVPRWLWSLSFAELTELHDPSELGKIAESLCLAERAFRRSSADRRPGIIAWECDVLGNAEAGLLPTTPMPPSAARDQWAQRRAAAAAARLALGAAIEAAFVDQAIDTMPVAQRGVNPSGSAAAGAAGSYNGFGGAGSCGVSFTRMTPEQRRTYAAQLYSDAFKSSVWTSAHAQYVAAVHSGLEEPAEPNLSTVPNAYAEFDCSDLFMRKHNVKSGSNKNTLAMINVLTRCTNPGARGWDSLLLSAMQETPAVRLVLINTLVVCTTGQHPHLHPALRAPWQKRLQLVHLLQHNLSGSETKKMIVDTAVYTKEAVRRLLASSLAESPALLHALAKLGHPAGQLTSPPHALPSQGMEAAMAAFATTGMLMLETKRSYGEVVSVAFGIHANRYAELEMRRASATAKQPPVSRKNGSSRANGQGKGGKAKHATAATTASLDGGSGAGGVQKSVGVDNDDLAKSCADHLRKMYAGVKDWSLLLGWSQTWLGKSGPTVPQKTLFTNLAAEVWSAAFRSKFVVLWAHSHLNGVRLSRLDQPQYAAMHGANSCTKLTLELTDEEALRVQRLALQQKSSGIFSLEEAATHLGIVGIKGGHKNAQDTLEAMASAGAKNAAKLLVFARAAWIHESLMIAEFGARTAGLQIRALHRRLKLDDSRIRDVPLAKLGESAARSTLPIYATHLHVCMECCRVANACVFDTLKHTAEFNELGVSTSMLSCVCDQTLREAEDGIKLPGEMRIRCAKRSSAALRGAVTFETDMKMRQVDQDTANPQAAANLLSQAAASRAATGDSGIAARIRRDSKHSLEQREHAVACGENDMLAVDLIGRAVRIFDEWFSLCTVCGAMLKVQPHTRFGIDICCLRCDARMLGQESTTSPHQSAKLCRYCGKVDDGTSKFKTVKAPLDLSGKNNDMPPPLRTVHYCAAHTRPWITSAHRTLNSRTILTHLALGSKPLSSADNRLTVKNCGHRGVGAGAGGSLANDQTDGLNMNDEFAVPQKQRRRRRRLTGASAS